MKQKKCVFHCYKDTRKENKKITNKFEKLELIIFDMDGVLTDIMSSWKYIHDYFETSNEKSVNDYLKGKIDDMEFIRRDAVLWKEDGKLITRKKLEEILSDVPLMKGAKECIQEIRKKEVKTAIVSAGLDVLAEKVAKDLGIDYVYSNGVKSDSDGRLTGEGILEVKLMYKDETIQRLAKNANIPLEHTAAVGNSCFDIPMFEVCGLGIAFNPEDDCVRDAADIVVEGKDLGKILPHIKKFILH